MWIIRTLLYTSGWRSIGLVAFRLGVLSQQYFSVLLSYEYCFAQPNMFATVFPYECLSTNRVAGPVPAG